MSGTKISKAQNQEEILKELDFLKKRTAALEASEKVLQYVEDALKESEKNYRALFDNMQSSFAIHKIELDDLNRPVDYVFLDVNHEFEKQLGLPKDKIIGHRVTEILPGIENDPTRWIDIFGKVALTGQAVSFESYLQPLDKWYSVSVYSPKEEEFATVFTDISERKKAEEERKRLDEKLRQSQKMEALRTLAGGIAHEFNNVLGSIVGFTELTIDYLPPESKGRYNLQKVLASSDRAAGMVNQILSFTSTGEKERKPVFLNNILKEALFLLRSSLPPNIEIQTSIPEMTNPILADYIQVHRAFMSILDNAAHAMKKTGGTLDVQLDEIILERDTLPELDLYPGKYQHTTIVDSGHGMDKETLNRIFDPYFTTKEVGEGMGMGLSAAHGIIENHGGGIYVQSSLGKGTRVCVYLPISSSGFLNYPKNKEIIPGGDEWILLVEDDSDLLESGRRMLEKLGYTVVMKKNSAEALKAFLSNPASFHLLITDQTMPGKTGLELAKEIRTTREDLPVILCTGFSDLINEGNFRELGIDAFVMKPFDRLKLARTIRQVLGPK